MARELRVVTLVGRIERSALDHGAAPKREPFGRHAQRVGVPRGTPAGEVVLTASDDQREVPGLPVRRAVDRTERTARAAAFAAAPFAQTQREEREAITDGGEHD